MTNFERAVAIVLEEEGGLVDDPKDPGGLTKYGISRRAYPKLDIRNLTRDDAKAIYLRDYWGPRGDTLPWPLCLLALDHAVNAGVGTAVRALQHVAGVPQDGVWGPATTAALARLDPEKASEVFAVERVRYYLACRDLPTFGLGWLGRVARVCLKANR